IGLVAWGQSKSEARVTAEFYGAAIGVMRGAERVSHYTALDRQEAFDIEYWLLEDAKLKRLPAEQPLDRTVAVVVGAGSGIGRALVRELVGQGAAVAAVDLHGKHAEAAAAEAQQKVGMGIGVAGTGISGAGQVVGLGADITDRAAVRRALEEVVLAYGGLDHVVVTAGHYPSPDEQGGVVDVPARARHRVAGQVRVAARRRGEHRGAARPAGGVLRPAHAHRPADHSRRPGQGDRGVPHRRLP